MNMLCNSYYLIETEPLYLKIQTSNTFLHTVCKCAVSKLHVQTIQYSAAYTAAPPSSGHQAPPFFPGRESQHVLGEQCKELARPPRQQQHLPRLHRKQPLAPQVTLLKIMAG